MSKKRVLITLTSLFFMAIAASSVYAIKFANWKYIDVLKLSRYDEERIAFQHVDTYVDPYLDDSIECLLVIHNKKMYLYKDGYDDESIVRENRLLLDMENKLYSDQEMWKNKMNGIPDLVIVTDRKIEIMKNFDEKFVSDKFGAAYKAQRDAFLKKHVQIFRYLMKNRKDSGLVVDKNPIDKPLYLGAPQNEPTKYSISASAKTIDETVYYCEDSDGDGVTETFTVNRPDGFNWGYQCGPNIVFIYKNKTKDLSDIIGKLAYESYYGTSEEEEEIIKTMPKQEEIIEMVNDLVPEQKFYK